MGRIVSVIAALIIIALIAVAFVSVGGDKLWHRLYAAWELRDVQVAPGFSEISQAYSFGLSGLKAYSLTKDSTSTGDYASAHGTKVAVEAQKEGADGQVYLLGKNGRALTDYPGRKAVLAVSPDGKFVTYSVATSTTAVGKLSSWRIHLYDLKAEKDTDLGPGFGGQFFERDGAPWLLYTTADGISVIDTATLKGFTTDSFDFNDDVAFMAKTSPDGTYIALRDSARLAFNLFKVTSISTSLPLGLEPLSTDVSGYSDILLTDSAAFGISDAALTKDDTETIERIPLSGGAMRTLYTYPATAGYRFMK